MCIGLASRGWNVKDECNLTKAMLDGLLVKFSWTG